MEGEVKPKEQQLSLIDVEEWWEEHWQGMPEFVQEDLMPWRSITVHFRNREDFDKFAELVQQRMTKLTPSIWFPEYKIQKRTSKYIDES